MESLKTPATRASIGMMLVVESPSYQRIGRMMDDINAAVAAVLEAHEARAEFDFTSFNTYPCKAALMNDQAYPTAALQYERPELPELTQHYAPTLS